MTFRFSRQGLTDREAALERLFEILPGATSWAILLGMLGLSFWKPILAAVLVIAFDLYWLLRLFYMTLFLILSSLRLSLEQGTDWMARVRGLDHLGAYLQELRHNAGRASLRQRLSRWVHRRQLEAFVRSGAPERTCVVARTNAWVEKYRAALEARGLETRTITRERRDDPGAPGLRFATMHRVKGLEFDRVVIAGANEKVLPLASALDRASDDAAREDTEQQERALFYVALTRARREVLVTSHVAPSRWLTAKPAPR